MKIEFDTDNIKNFPKKVWSKMTPEHILLLSMFAVISIPALIDKYNASKQGSCCVEVTLEKPDKNEIIVAPRTKTAQLFNTGNQVYLSKKEFDCLARNIYWEALREPLIGQLAVANITYNRVLSKKWGNTFCQVVFEPKQFSWTNSKKLRNAKPKNENQWNRAKHSAMLFSKGVRVTNLDDSEFYYAQYIKQPKWAKTMEKQAHIGQHIFFSDKTDVAQMEEFE